jgi:hypothetical protein
MEKLKIGKVNERIELQRNKASFSHVRLEM